MIRSAARDSKPSFGKMALVVISQAITALMSLLISFLLARWTQQTALGEFFFYNGASTAISSLIASPIGMWLTRSQHVDPDLTLTIKKFWIWLCLAISTLAAAMAFVCTNEMINLSILNCGLIVGIALFTFSWNSSGYSTLFSVGTLIPALFRLITLLVFFNYLSLTDSATIFLISVLSAFGSLVCLFVIDRITDGQATPSFTSLFKLNQISQHLNTGKSIIWFMLLSSSIYTLYQFTDKLIAKSVIGFSGIASVTLLMQWSYLVMTMGLQPFIALAYPRILQAREEQGLRVIRMFVALFVALTVLAEILFAFCEKAIRGFIPENYSELTGILWLGILAGGFFMIGQMLSTWFSKAGNEHNYVSTIILPSAIGVTAMYTGATLFGVTGIVFGHLLFSITYVASCAFSVKRSRGQHRH